MPVQSGGHTLGVVTSGTLSPMLNVGIALAYVDKEHAALGTKLSIDVRGKPVEAEVVKLPFV